MKRFKNQMGFTLIELIMVIVIMGVLSAFALPRFVDLGGSGRQAALEGIEAAVRGGMVAGNASGRVQGMSLVSADVVVVIDGQNANLTFGFPSATSDPNTNIDSNGIVYAAGIADFAEGDDTEMTEGDILIDVASPTALNFTSGNCRFVYTEATSSSAPAEIARQITSDGGSTWSAASEYSGC